MMTDEASLPMPTPRRGRPPKPDEERLYTHTLRLTLAEIEKLRRLGGSRWVSQRLKKVTK